MIQSGHLAIEPFTKVALPQSHPVLFHLLQNTFSGKRVAKVLQKRIGKI
jgi:hypothetical protein